MAKITLDISEYNAIKEEQKKLQNENTDLKNKITELKDNITIIMDTIYDIQKMPLIQRIIFFKKHINNILSDLKDDLQ